MGLLPMGADILPPSDDRVFKLILTSPEAKTGLMNLISSIISRTRRREFEHAETDPPLL